MLGWFVRLPFSSARQGVLAAALAVALSALVAASLEARAVRAGADRYLIAWESTLARSLLTGESIEDSRLVMSQLLELYPALALRSLANSSGQEFAQASAASCLLPFRRDLWLHSLKAGTAEFCVEPAALVGRSMSSPIFLSLLLILTILGLAIVLREWRHEVAHGETRLHLEAQTRMALLGRQVAHDIRGPLSALRLLTSQGDVGTSREAGLLSMASDRIQKIADDLLERTRDDRTSRTASACRASEVVEELWPELLCRFHQHRLQSSLANEVMQIGIDGSELRRVVSNLVQNAVEASAAISMPITVAVRATTESVSVIVADEGQGMGPELIARLGEKPFSQGKADGNGLGLSQAFRLAKSAGGRVEIRSAPGRGTQVEMVFPVTLR